jgi:serine/threonine protein kinase
MEVEDEGFLTDGMGNSNVGFCRYIMKQLFDALLFVHTKDIVHRDLKPENVLLDNNFNVKLTDFGFAKILQPGEKLFGKGPVSIVV